MSSLGCDKNLVDAERMLGVLSDDGFVITDDESEADAAIVNTCCFIDSAKKESIEEILRLASFKEEGKLRALVVSGCLAERYRGEILKELPEVDAIIGAKNLADAARAVRGVIEGKELKEYLEGALVENRKLKRLVSTGGHYAYLKIAEGCDKFCSYCILPHIRGRYTSFPMEELLAEADKLAAGGVRELIVIAQETTLYGTDIYGEKRLHVLLKELAKIEGIHWIRVLYCYPEEIYPELIETMASEPKICRYLDLPIQSGSDAVLAAMGRRTDTEYIRGLVGRLREAMPDITLRTSLIAGFPGETEKEHEETLDFVRELRFDRLGVFEYSREEGTRAASFKNQVHYRTKARRRRELMEAQQEISLEKNRRLIGMAVEAVVDGYLPEEEVYEGRTRSDVPGVDGLIFFKSDRAHDSGDFVELVVTGAMEYDLIGEEREMQ